MSKFFVTVWLLGTLMASGLGHRARPRFVYPLERPFFEGEKQYSSQIEREGNPNLSYPTNKLSGADLFGSVSKREYYGLDTADYTESREKNGAKKLTAMKKLIPFTSMLQQLTSAVNPNLIAEFRGRA